MVQKAVPVKVLIDRLDKVLTLLDSIIEDSSLPVWSSVHKEHWECRDKLTTLIDKLGEHNA